MLSRTLDLLRAAVASRQWDAMTAILSRLSHAEFRRTERGVREELMVELRAEDVWTVWGRLVAFRPHAFLSSILTLSSRAAQGLPIALDSSQAAEACAPLTPQQAAKVADMLLPALTTEADILQLFRLLRIDDEQQRASVLVRTLQPLPMFILLRTLQHSACSQQLAQRVYRHLAAQESDRARNMASILHAYFGLDATGVRPTLRIEPYELEYISSSFEHFRYFLDGKRPTVPRI
jgi:hypothetical protein